MKERLNILFISSWFPTPDKPTHGNFIKNHAMVISKYCNVNAIYVYKKEEQIEKYLFTKSIEDNLTIDVCSFRTSKCKLKVLRNLSDIITFWKSYKTLFDQLPQKPDIIHANVVFPIGLFALYLKIRYGLKYVLSEHWSALEKSKIGFWKRNLIQIIFKKGSYILPVSNHLKSKIEEFTDKKEMVIIPNSINTQLFNLKDKNHSEIFKWIHISTLDPVKNVEGIVRSFAKLINEDPKNHLTIVTDGPSSSIRKLIEELKIPKELYEVIGESTYSEIAQYLKRSDACVQFSHSETFGIVAAEALCCGLPLVSTRVGFLEDVEELLVGKYVDICNENDLLHKMKSLKKLDFNSFHTHQYFSGLFNESIVANSFIDIYKIVLNQ